MTAKFIKSILFMISCNIPLIFFPFWKHQPKKRWKYHIDFKSFSIHKQDFKAWLSIYSHTNQQTLVIFNESDESPALQPCVSDVHSSLLLADLSWNRRLTLPVLVNTYIVLESTPQISSRISNITLHCL